MKSINTAAQEVLLFGAKLSAEMKKQGVLVRLEGSSNSGYHYTVKCFRDAQLAGQFDIRFKRESFWSDRSSVTSLEIRINENSARARRMIFDTDLKGDQQWTEKAVWRVVAAVSKSELYIRKQADEKAAQLERERQISDRMRLAKESILAEAAELVVETRFIGEVTAKTDRVQSNIFVQPDGTIRIKSIRLDNAGQLAKVLTLLSSEDF